MKTVGMTHEQFKTQVCSVCRHENALEAEFCLKCRRPLSLKTLIKMEEKKKEPLRLITSDVTEQMVQKKVEEILAKHNSNAQAQAKKEKEVTS